METLIFNVDRTTEVVASCNCPVNATSSEIGECQRMFEAALKDYQIKWDTLHIDTVHCGDDNTFKIITVKRSILKLTVC